MCALNCTVSSEQTKLAQTVLFYNLSFILSLFLSLFHSLSLCLSLSLWWRIHSCLRLLFNSLILPLRSSFFLFHLLICVPLSFPPPLHLFDCVCAFLSSLLPFSTVTSHFLSKSIWRFWLYIKAKDSASLLTTVINEGCYEWLDGWLWIIIFFLQSFVCLYVMTVLRENTWIMSLQFVLVCPIFMCVILHCIVCVYARTVCISYRKRSEWTEWKKCVSGGDSLCSVSSLWCVWLCVCLYWFSLSSLCTTGEPRTCIRHAKSPVT